MNTREIRKHFGQGVRRLFALDIWREVWEGWYKNVPNLTQASVAAELGFDQVSSVSRGCNLGELSLEGLVIMLTNAGKTWQALPHDVPPVEQTVLAGYLVARAYLAQKSRPVGELQCVEDYIRHAEMTVDDFLSFLALRKHQNWSRFQLLRRSRAVHDLGWRRNFAAEVLDEVAKVLARPIEFPGCDDPDGRVAYLDQLNARWAGPYLQVVKAFPLLGDVR